MAHLRPGKIDRNVDKPSYTRKKYIRGVPGLKIVHFDMGNTRRNFPFEVSLMVNEPVQIRHNALEAARVISHRYLEKRIGPTNYHMKIRTFPHEILRENRMASGKKADRYGDGMRRSFGKPVGTAARLEENQKVISVWVDENRIAHAKEALRKAGHKFPVRVTICVGNA
ncbi:MAG: 50S ribosomal protein L16 [Theionarchaea archaeon]|nr:50S ribosomal protein L16 [Theionarchaea archaeon]MBU7001298.1 50S ribosomal protein L16 [Theionarchaea archaeon]MBU7022175.1 50S ribosomal protein L16 [Theionarchaea archaeon]MBU7039706.1 50S ribosomal protein L16 [Theionarchaea archaeon]